ncbi:hypothetical protein HYU22_00015 [Candidatus Woesearchaeota archaeon]|nr:hypothetical protein [Candidatus Woesearchaeota archaeon]
MTRTSEQIAVTFLEDFLMQYGIEKERFYGLIRALEEVPYLAEIHPTIHLGSIGRGDSMIGLDILVAYTGDQQLGGEQVPKFVAAPKPEIQPQVEALYADLAIRTGFKFYDPSSSLVRNCCTAKVPMGEEAEGRTYHQELSVILSGQRK